MHDEHDPHYEVLQHYVQDILKIIEEIKAAEGKNTVFRERVQGALVIIPVTVAVVALVINLLR